MNRFETQYLFLASLPFEVKFLLWSRQRHNQSTKVLQIINTQYRYAGLIRSSAHAAKEVDEKVCQRPEILSPALVSGEEVIPVQRKVGAEPRVGHRGLLGDVVKVTAAKLAGIVDKANGEK